MWLAMFRSKFISEPIVLSPRSERRGALKAVPVFYDTSTVFAQVTAAVKTEQKSAWEKKSNPGHWGSTGDVELAACSDALRALEAVDRSLPVREYLLQLNAAFSELIEKYRSNDLFDRDGYGLGTLHAIASVFKIG